MKQFIIPASYEKVMESELKEIGLKGSVLLHKKSGARLICLPSEDENKVFFIGFRTPPVDDSGLPHILEHSVLCGSDKYPIKDPFMELSKSSLNTFLNAMTYPDKTLYPVASCNDKDFANLMDVYMDAVLHPLIHQNPNIFRQEGWRYELKSPEEEIGLNGVVYSEMKGAFSSSEETLARYAVNSLFPDTAYGFESGGDPACIPNLSYEDFCAFHKKLYHPSNSYIFLYGNMDMEERLNYLDEAYLSHYEREEVDSALGWQKPFANRRDIRVSYPVGEEENPQEKSFYSLQWVVGDLADSRLGNAFDVLDTVLLNAPGAPLKQALLDAGLAKDAGGGYLNDLRQPVFSISAKEGKEGEKERFLKVVTDCLTDICEKGLNPKSLRAAISNREFQRREADYGGFPKGLVYGLMIMQTWLHEEDDPFRYLRFEDDFKFLKESISQGYFEQIIREYLLENPHCSLVEMNPEPGKAGKDDAALKEKMKKYKESLSSEEIALLVEQSRELKAYQEEEETPEARACVPKLKKKDIKKQARISVNEESQAGPAKLIYRHLPTAGIAYASLYFNLENIPGEHLPWLGLLKACFATVSTASHDYRDLYDTILENTGGLYFNLESIRNLKGEWKAYGRVSAKALYDKWPETAALIREICLDSSFAEDKRLTEILGETLINLKQTMIMAGHRAAVQRAASYYSEAALFSELTGGLDFLRFASDLADHFEERKEEAAIMLKQVAGELFTADGMIINLSCEEKAFASLKAILAELAESFPRDPLKRLSLPAFQQKNEGIKTTGAVSYVAHCGSYAKAGPYTGALKVLNSILGMDYLWQNLRVLGGAYGAMSQFGITGHSYLVSYRDPNLRRTEEVYQAIPAYLENLELAEETLESFIISTIGGMDVPYTPSLQGSVDFSNYICGISADFQQKERDEVLSCSLEDLKNLVPYLRAVLADGNICAYGSSIKIEEEKEMFHQIINL